MSKHFIYLAILLVQSFYSYSQTSTYHPFPTDTARWGMYHSQTFYFGSQVSGFAENHYNDELRGDTIINGMTYSKVYSNNVLLGGLREDANRQVWFYGFSTASGYYFNGITYTTLPPYTPNTDLLLYDFSLTTGDSILLCAFFENPISTYTKDTVLCKVVGEDSLWLIDGSYRRMLAIEASTLPNTTGSGGYPFIDNLYWVEGIGAIRYNNRQYVEGNGTLTSDPMEDNGLFGSVYFENAGLSGQLEANVVSCFFDHTTQYIGVNRGTQCSNTINTSLQPTATAQVTITPNPFHQQTIFTVKTTSIHSNYTFLLYNSTGQLIEQVSSASSIITLERHEKTAGLYFYQIWGDQSLLNTGKVAIE